MRRTTIYIAALVILACLVVGALLFQSRDNKVVACDPPCWRGIIPGETTYEGVDHILKSASDLSLRSRRTTSDGSEQWLFRFTGFRPKDEMEEFILGLWNDVVGTEGVVESINVSPYPLRSAQEVVDQFGPPEKMVATRTGREIVRYEAYLYYPGKGAIFHLILGPPQRSQLTLSPSDVVYIQTYFGPRSVDELLASASIFVPGLAYRSFGETGWGLVPWNSPSVPIMVRQFAR